MSQSDSYFFTEPTLDSANTFTDLAVVHGSPNSHAVVYRARRSSKWIVLKGLRQDLRSNPLYIEILKKEFDIGYNLDYHGIVRVMSLENIPSVGPCIVMEWIDGENLQEYLTHNRLSEKDALRIIEEIGKAVDYLHRRQVIHRDLKPSNIMITADGAHVKIIDFGFADARSYATLKLSGGTPPWCPPEQMAGAGSQITSKSDIYAVGRIAEAILSEKQRIKYRKLISLCTANEPDKRPTCVDEALQLAEEYKKKKQFWFAAILLTLLAAFAIFVYYFTKDSFQNVSTDKTTPGLQLDPIESKTLNADESAIMNMRQPDVIIESTPQSEHTKEPSSPHDISFEEISEPEDASHIDDGTGDIESVAAKVPVEIEEKKSASDTYTTKPIGLDLRSLHPIAQIIYNKIKAAAEASPLHDDAWKQKIREDAMDEITKYLKPGNYGYSDCLYAIDRALSDFE